MTAYAYESRLQQLTTEEKSLVEQLKQDVSDVVQNHAPLQVYCHDWTYVRYLTARGWNLQKAAKMLRATLQWRMSYKPHEVTWDDVAEDGATGKQFVMEHLDKQGRPVVVMRPRNENTKNVEGQIKYLVYTLERASALADIHGVGKATILVDYEGYSMKNAPAIKTSISCLHIMQNHYPERLAVALCWHAPTLFSVTWKAVSPFIDVVTSKKVVFINKGTDEKAIMEAWLDMANVEESMGGQAKGPAFVKEQYAGRMRAHDEEALLKLASAAALFGSTSQAPKVEAAAVAEPITVTASG